MSTLGLGLGNNPNGPGNAGAPNVSNALLAQRMQAESQLKSGCSWFIWIAGLSLVNTIAAYTGSNWGFAAGLGITQVVDAVARRAGAPGLIVGLAINVMAAGFFVLMWLFARRAQKWAIITGMVLYGLDSLLILSIGLIFGLVIHALGLYGMVRGLKASSELARITESEQRQAVGATAASIG